jgi:hypothetical protein
MTLIDSHLLDIGPAPWDQGTQPGQSLGLFQQGALLGGADRYGPFSPTLGPTRFEVQVCAPVRPAGLNLDGLLPSEPECLLQPQAHSYMFTFHQGELILGQVFGFTGVGHKLPIRDPIKFIGAGHDGPLVNLLGPPA